MCEALEPRLAHSCRSLSRFLMCSIKRLEVFPLPLDGMQVHRRSLPRNFVRFPQQIAGTHLYTWVERGTVRVKCLAQEHNTLSPARARTRTARSGVQRTNHEANATHWVFLSFLYILLRSSNLRSFMILTCTFTSHGFIRNSESDQFPVALIAQWLSTVIAKVVGSYPVKV